MKYRIFLVAAAVILTGAGCANQPQNLNQEKNTNIPVTTTGTRLDLSGQGLTELPKNVLQRTDLTELNISNNRLTGALPAEIRMLAKLKILNAGNNAMTGVPAEIGQLSELQVLDLSSNKLTGLPLELGNLVLLQTLDLRGNEYSKYDLDLIRKNLPNTNILVDGTIAAYDSGVAGKVLLGPTCPVQRVPPDPNCADKPYQTTIQVIAANSPKSSVFATTESGKDGTFKIMLPPGEYALQAVGGKVKPRCGTANVTVKPGVVSKADISCDTGIR